MAAARRHSKVNARGRRCFTGSECPALVAVGRALHSHFIGPMPTGYTIKQKYVLLLTASPLARYWDGLQMLLSLASW
jgi:hypothetical protein